MLRRIALRLILGVSPSVRPNFASQRSGRSAAAVKTIATNKKSRQKYQQKDDFCEEIWIKSRNPGPLSDVCFELGLSHRSEY
jgi:hypothetical protein